MTNRTVNIKTWFRELTKRFPWLTSISLVTLIFLFVNRLLVLGKASSIWDAEVYFSKYYALVSDASRAGRFLFWNPWSSAGEPIMADPQIGVFSPLTVLFGLITGGSWRGFTIYWLFLWWLGGLGMLLLARHLGAPPWGASVVALGFLFCGLYTGNAEHTPVIASFSFLPFVIWRLDAALNEQRVWPAIEAGALWGLSALTGYPAFTMITGMYAGVWALGYLVIGHSAGAVPTKVNTPGTGKARRSSPYFVLVAVAALLLVGMLVMSPTYFSFLYEGLGYTARSGPLSREMAIGGNALHPGALATFSSPYLILLKYQGDLRIIWAYTDLSSCSIYAGVVVTALAVFGFVMKSRSGWHWWLLVIAALAIGCALGRTLPLRGWMYDFVYPTRFFRHSSLFRGYYLFTVCVLALLATKRLSAGELQPNERWKLLGAISVLALGALVAIDLVHLVMPINLGGAFFGEVLHFVAIWGGMLAVTFVVAKWPTLGSRPYLPIALTILAVLDVFGTGSAAKSMTMTTNQALLEYKSKLETQHRTTIDMPNGLAREYRSVNLLFQILTNENLITKTPVFLDLSTQHNEFYYAMTANESLWTTATGDERIWFSPAAGQAKSTKECFKAFAERTKQLGAPPLVIQSPAEILKRSSGNQQSIDNTDWAVSMSALPPAERIHVNLIRYAPEKLSFDVDAPAAGWLLVTDRWARSWQATVNGESTPVYCGNFIFRAVRVTAGHNRVEFSYETKKTYVLLIISWGCLVLAFAGTLFSSRRRGETSGPTEV